MHWQTYTRGRLRLLLLFEVGRSLGSRRRKGFRQTNTYFVKYNAWHRLKKYIAATHIRFLAIRNLRIVRKL